MVSEVFFLVFFFLELFHLQKEVAVVLVVMFVFGSYVVLWSAIVFLNKSFTVKAD